MQIPAYWLPIPEISLDSETRQAFDQLYRQFIAQPQSGPMPYTLAAPKWQFLNYVAETYNLALHGSGNLAITHFEPRQPLDLSAFGNQLAVYAATDAIWAMFFAISDREHFDVSVTNGCIRVVTASGEVSPPHYFFSMTREILHQGPWRTGAIYLLPRASFAQEPPMYVEGLEVHSAQLASLVPVDPLAHLIVEPDDFPFLKQIRGHEDSRLAEYAQAMQTGAPWPMMGKVLAYITRHKNGELQLLVFDHHHLPEAGTQVPAGTIEPNESIEAALWREVAEESGLTQGQLELVSKLAQQESLEWGTIRHVFHLTADGSLPETWSQRVAGSGEDQGFVFDYYWIDMKPGLELAGNQHDWLGLIGNS